MITTNPGWLILDFGIWITIQNNFDQDLSGSDCVRETESLQAKRKTDKCGGTVRKQNRECSFHLTDLLHLLTDCVYITHFCTTLEQDKFDQNWTMSTFPTGLQQTWLHYTTIATPIACVNQDNVLVNKQKENPPTNKNKFVSLLFGYGFLGVESMPCGWVLSHRTRVWALWFPGGAFSIFSTVWEPWPSPQEFLGLLHLGEPQFCRVVIGGGERDSLASGSLWKLGYMCAWVIDWVSEWVSEWVRSASCT